MTEDKPQSKNRTNRQMIESARKREIAFRKTEAGSALVKFENATANAWIADCRENISSKRLDAVWETQYAAREKIVSSIESLQQRVEELESAIRPFVSAFPATLDWYRRRHDLNVLAEMLSLPVPITPENIALLHRALSEEPGEEAT